MLYFMHVFARAYAMYAFKLSKDITVCAYMLYKAYNSLTRSRQTLSSTQNSQNEQFAIFQREFYRFTTAHSWLSEQD